MPETSTDNEWESAMARGSAMLGKQLPMDLSKEYDRCALNRGIRFHDGFAESLRNSDGIPKDVIRSLNARWIMSNKIPTMENEDERPYCFWYPESASEQTLRDLASKYPQLRYNVGRACAVAGYDKLYHELNLLPEASIAEEARYNHQSGRKIFDHIMAQPTLYAVMNDYDRTVNLENPRAGALLNGDTCVRPLLELRINGRQKPSDINMELLRKYVNIAEDRHFDVYGCELKSVDPEIVQLVYNLLPTHLPTVDKDLLILMAAYYGNIERYARLRRPNQTQYEGTCLVRGLYHSTPFAKWFSEQPKERQSESLQRAINARFIMDNDISRISTETPLKELPYVIWYPSKPLKSTLRRLVEKDPRMKDSVEAACVHLGHKDLFEELKPEPLWYLEWEAEQVSDSFFGDYLKARTARREELGLGQALSAMDDFGCITTEDPSLLLLNGNMYGQRRSDDLKLSANLNLDRLGFAADGYSVNVRGDEGMDGLNLFLCRDTPLEPAEEWRDLRKGYFDAGAEGRKKKLEKEKLELEYLYLEYLDLGKLEEEKLEEERLEKERLELEKRELVYQKMRSDLLLEFENLGLEYKKLKSDLLEFEILALEKLEREKKLEMEKLKK